MAIKRNRRFHAEVATSALSDIMFFLLLFFLIISTLANPNVIKVPLPKSDANEKTQQQHVTLTVKFDDNQQRHFYVNNDEIAFDQLEGVLIGETKKAWRQHRHFAFAIRCPSTRARRPPQNWHAQWPKNDHCDQRRLVRLTLNVKKTWNPIN